MANKVWPCTRYRKWKTATHLQSRNCTMATSPTEGGHSRSGSSAPLHSVRLPCLRFAYSPCGTARMRKPTLPYEPSCPRERGYDAVQYSALRPQLPPRNTRPEPVEESVH